MIFVKEYVDSAEKLKLLLFIDLMAHIKMLKYKITFIQSLFIYRNIKIKNL